MNAVSLTLLISHSSSPGVSCSVADPSDRTAVLSEPRGLSNRILQQGCFEFQTPSDLGE